MPLMLAQASAAVCQQVAIQSTEAAEARSQSSSLKVSTFPVACVLGPLHPHLGQQAAPGTLTRSGDGNIAAEHPFPDWMTLQLEGPPYVCCKSNSLYVRTLD